MGKETFVVYPQVYGYVEPVFVPQIPQVYAYAPIEVVPVRGKFYGPYGPYTYGPY
jgi:hypothetical protein